MGLFARASHRLVIVSECLVLAPELEIVTPSRDGSVQREQAISEQVCAFAVGAVEVVGGGPGREVRDARVDMVTRCAGVFGLPFEHGDVLAPVRRPEGWAATNPDVGVADRVVSSGDPGVRAHIDAEQHADTILLHIERRPVVRLVGSLLEVVEHQRRVARTSSEGVVAAVLPAPDLVILRELGVELEIQRLVFGDLEREVPVVASGVRRFQRGVVVPGDDVAARQFALVNASLQTPAHLNLVGDFQGVRQGRGVEPQRYRPLSERRTRQAQHEGREQQRPPEIGSGSHK